MILNTKVSYLTVSLLLVLLTACSTGVSPTPPPISTVSQTPIVLPPMNIISIRLDEIRLNTSMGESSIPLDSVWMIPLSNFSDSMTADNTVDMGAKFEYFENQTINISQNSPYVPSSDWFISTDKQNLNNESFGIWFIITSTNNINIRDEIMAEFVGLLGDSIPLIGAGALTAVLLPITPGIPDEVIPATVAVSRGRNVMGRISAIAALSPVIFQEVIRSVFPEMVLETSDFVHNIIRVANLAKQMGYYGEVLVLFSVEDNYRLNSRVIAETTDGALTLVFTVFESSTHGQVASTTNNEFSEVEITNEQCSTINSTIIAGQQARISGPYRYISIYKDPISPNSLALGEIRSEMIITPTMSYCNQNTQTLWWAVCVNDICGWVAESDTQNRFLEGI